MVIEGPVARAVAAVEHGGPIAGPMFDLSREAAEDVFRTLATEPTRQRVLNPGLPLHLSDVVVGGVVRLLRSCAGSTSMSSRWR